LFESSIAARPATGTLAAPVVQTLQGVMRQRYQSGWFRAAAKQVAKDPKRYELNSYLSICILRKWHF
jgi:hypothetical protein